MPHPDEHFDELLKKAAEGYGIKTGTDRWNDISSALKEPPSRRRNRWLLWLPALLLGAGLSGWFAHEWYTENNNLKKTVAQQTAGKLRAAKQQHDTHDETKITKRSTQAHTAENLNSVSGGVQQSGQQAATATAEVKGSVKANYSFTSSNKAATITVQATNNYTIEQAGLHQIQPNELASLSLYKFTSVYPTLNKKLSAGYFSGVIREKIIAGNNQDKTPVHASVTVSDSKMYLRLQSGLQFNSVAMQGGSAVSPTIGILLGRKIGKRWSAEIGLQAERMRYKTTGSRFAMKANDMGMPAGSEIMYVNGTSNLLSLPLRINRVVNIVKSGWQTQVGASINPSILTRESNDYHAQTNGQQVDFKGLYTSKKIYAAGMLGLHASVSPPPLGRWRLHAEPFVKIPLQKIGVGKLPVATAGLQVAVTIPFQKQP